MDKVVYWSTKATISLKRVQMEEKLLWKASRNSPTLFRTVSPRPPTASSSPRLGVLNPHPKLQLLLSQERMKAATNFKFGRNIHRVHSDKSTLKILAKRQREHIQGLPKFFWVPPIISGTGKAANFKFCTHFIHSISRKKSPLKISRKVVVGIVRDSRKFSGHSYIGRIARSSLR